MYQFMNKNREVANFIVSKGVLGDRYVFSKTDAELLPVGFIDIESWLANRKGSKHNDHLKKLMIMCGCENNEGFIKITHAASINDTFWIKTDKENISWEQVSLYRNEYNDIVSKLAFEGIGLYGIQLSSTSPELSTEGSFRKCWQREADGIYLYKRGKDGARNVGLEPYCESMGAELTAKICHDTVLYSLVRLHGELASKCRLFTDEKYGYVPYSRFRITHSPDDMLKFYSDIGSEDSFRRMIVADSITFNVDRHTGNHGVLVDNDTLQPIKMAPVFDMNLSLLPYVEMYEFTNIGNKLMEYGPKIGEDFTRIGQMVITSEIRSDLIGLKGFEFSFRGDEKFSIERVKALEEIVNRQIEAVLSRNILYTKDVFVPNLEMTVEPQVVIDLSGQEAEARLLSEKLLRSGDFEQYNLNICEEHVELLLKPLGMKGAEICINLADKSVWAEVEGSGISYFDCITDYPSLAQCYEIAENILNEKYSMLK